MSTIAGKSVSGTLTGTGTVGPYQPIAGQPFNVFITGTFVATVELQKSFDGSTFITIASSDLSSAAVFNGPAAVQFIEGDAAVTYQLNVTAYTSGSVALRIG